MRIKTFLLFLCFYGICGYGAEQIKPFNNDEMTRYIKSTQSSCFDPAVPHLARTQVTTLLEEIYSKFVQVEIPSTLQSFKTKKGATLPSQSLLLLEARKLKILMANKELEEVSGISLAWFTKVGQALTALDGCYSDLVRAIQDSDDRLYAAAYAKQAGLIQQLDQIMSKPARLTAAQLKKVQQANYNMRKQKYKALEKRYNKTIELQEKAEKAAKAKKQKK